MPAIVIFLGLTAGTAIFQGFMDTPDWNSVILSSVDYATALLAYVWFTK